MTPEELQRLIAGGETLAVEFKGEEKTPLNDRELIEGRLLRHGERKGAWYERGPKI